MDKASDETINKTYVEYRQCELNEKGEKTGKALFKHAINLYSTRISRWVKIKDVNKLRQDIENDPIIKDQVAGLGCLFVCTFGNYLAPVLIAAYLRHVPDHLIMQEMLAGVLLKYLFPLAFVPDPYKT